MNQRRHCLIAASILAFLVSAPVAVCQAGSGTDSSAEQAPVRALLITGGCCHDYDFQTAALKKAAEQFGADVRWTVVNEGGNGTEAQIELYDREDWASEFDVVVHNECFANTDDPEYIRKITSAHHRGANAVVIHCAMHTYRKAAIDDWREFLGVTSRRHEHKSRYPVKAEQRDHPIMHSFPDEWTTPSDELYVIEKVWPKARILASSASEKDGKLYPVIWVNEYGKARVFGTTYGHSNETFEDPVFLQTVVRGMLWAAGRLPEQPRDTDTSQ